MIERRKGNDDGANFNPSAHSYFSRYDKNNWMNIGEVDIMIALNSIRIEQRIDHLCKYMDMCLDSLISAVKDGHANEIVNIQTNLHQIREELVKLEYFRFVQVLHE